LTASLLSTGRTPGKPRSTAQAWVFGFAPNSVDAPEKILDFVNGFNDSANSVATVIGTRVLKPLHAVALSAAANFVGPFVFGVAVATTIAKGIVSPDEITVYMIIGGLAGAIAWSSLCTYFGLPISNSHSLIGGIMGAGIIGLGFEQLVYGGLTKVFAGIIIAPIV